MKVRRDFVARAILWGVALGGLFAAWQAFGWHPTARGGDAWNYLAAGERLNAGHPLYALQIDDRPVPIVPPYWTVPLLAPPPVAVLWRPLALLGDGSMVLWGVAALASVTAVAWTLRSAPLILSLFAAPVALTALSGNSSAFIMAAFVAAWACRDRPMVLGALIAAATALKLTPAILLVWLIATRRWRALKGAFLVGAAILLVGLAFAGPGEWVDWYRSVPESAASPLALATLTGLPTWVVAFAGAASVAVVWIVTRSDAATFAAAVVAAALATPALYFQALALIVAAAAPLALRARDPSSLGARLRDRQPPI